LKQATETTTDFQKRFPAPELLITVNFHPEMSYGTTAEGFLNNPDLIIK